MKWSGNAPPDPSNPLNAAEGCLIVDGYNVIARLEKTALPTVADLEASRHDLVQSLADYAAYTGEVVIVVFDAHRAGGSGSDEMESGVRVVYTMQNETADDRIERLVYDLRRRYDRITVATSDAAEQQVTFGGGALRISADELLRRLASVREEVRERIRPTKAVRRLALADTVRQDVAKILEIWRRQ